MLYTASKARGTKREGGLDLGGKVNEEENDPLGVRGINGKDISKKERTKELKTVVMKARACEKNKRTEETDAEWR